MILENKMQDVKQIWCWKINKENLINVKEQKMNKYKRLKTNILKNIISMSVSKKH